jgi:hypothetical protein
MASRYLGKTSVLGEFHGEQGEVEDLAHLVQDVLALLFQQGFGEAAGNAGHRVDGLAGEFVQDHFGHLRILTTLLGQFGVGLDDADDVAHGIVAVGADHEIGGGQEEEVQQLVFGVG